MTHPHPLDRYHASILSHYGYLPIILRPTPVHGGLLLPGTSTILLTDETTGTYHPIPAVPCSTCQEPSICSPCPSCSVQFPRICANPACHQVFTPGTKHNPRLTCSHPCATALRTHQAATRPSPPSPAHAQIQADSEKQQAIRTDRSFRNLFRILDIPA